MKWEKIKLGSVCDVRDGTHDSPKYVENGYPLLTSKNIKNGRLDFSDINFISEKDYHEINKRSKVDLGDIIMPMIGTIGNPIVVDIEPDFAIKNVCLIKKSKSIFNRYVYFLLQSSHFESTLLNKSRGGTQKFLSLSDIRNFLIPLPPLHIQEQIANTLDKAGALRRKDQEMLTKYDELAQGIFYDMFGDPVKNEKGWRISKFGSIIKSIRYGTGSPPKYSENGIPFIRATNIKGGRITNNGMVFLSKDEASKIEKCYIKEGDLIIVRSGINTGDCGLITMEFDRSLAGYDLIIEIDKPFNTFYHYLINSIWGQKIIKPLSRRAAQPHLNAEQLKNVEFIIPDERLIQRFHETINLIEKKRKIIENSQTKSRLIFDGALKTYFS